MPGHRAASGVRLQVVTQCGGGGTLETRLYLHHLGQRALAACVELEGERVTFGTERVEAAIGSDQLGPCCLEGFGSGLARLLGFGKLASCRGFQCLCGVCARVDGSNVGLQRIRVAKWRLIPCRQLLERRFGRSDTAVQSIECAGLFVDVLRQGRSLCFGPGKGPVRLGLRRLRGLQDGPGRGEARFKISTGLGLTPVLSLDRLLLILKRRLLAGKVVQALPFACLVVSRLAALGLELPPATGHVVEFAAEESALVRDPLDSGARLRFRLPQLRQFVLQGSLPRTFFSGRGRGRRDVPSGAVEVRPRRLALFLRCPPAMEGQSGVSGPQPVGYRTVSRGLTGLSAKHGKPRLLGAQQVVHAGEVLFSGSESEFGLMPSGMHTHNACGLFQQPPAIRRLGVNDRVDMPLRHDGMRAGAERAVGKQQLHVPGAHFALVDEEGGAVAPPNAATDLDRVRVVERRWGATVLVVDDDPDFGEIPGRAGRSSVEDDVVHFGRTHAAGGVFPHRPAKGFDQVGLAAAVRAHDTGHAGADFERRLFDEGLEPG